MPWKTSDAPEDFTSGLMESLVGLEVEIERLEGEVKASQNQPERNQESILKALRDEQPNTDLTALMHSVLSSRTSG